MAGSGSRRAAGQQRGGAADATRAALVDAAVAALREQGFAGASAREIARRADCNQALVFYHFGSVVNLHLAALDQVSAERQVRYQAAVEGATSLRELIGTARGVVTEDLDQGHVAVLATMIAAAQSTPGLGAQVAARIAPWREFAARSVQDVLGGVPFAGAVPADEVAHAVVALYLGLEMLASLDGDRAPAQALFDRAGKLAPLLDALGRATLRRRRVRKRRAAREARPEGDPG